MLSELRLALRSLRRSPIFSLSAVATLTFGIAASTAIFSLFYQVLLRSLPVPSPQQLVLFHSNVAHLPGSSSSDSYETVFSNPTYRALRDGIAPSQFQGLAARSSATGQLTGNTASDRISVEIVSGNFFSILGLHPAAGRLLLPSDDSLNSSGKPITESVAVISYAYWVKHFGGSASALGRVTHINTQPFTIVGVAPAAFAGLLSSSQPDLFVPINAKPLISRGWTGLDEPSVQWLTIFGRLQPSSSREQAFASLQPLWKSLLRSQFDRLNIKDAPGRTRLLATNLELRPASQGLNQLEADWRKPLNALLAMVGLLLLIACANVANLLIARGLARRREMAIRVAIGANRWRLLRQTLAESWLLAAIAGVLGMALSIAFLRLLLLTLPPNEVGSAITATLDPAVLGFSILAVLLTNTIFGFLPALFSARLDPMPALKDQTGNASASGSHTKWRQLLVAAQLGLSLALLVGAGLFGKTLFSLLSHSPGFLPDHLLSFSLDPRLSGYDYDGSERIYHAISERLQSLPYAQSVAMAQDGPLFNSRSITNVSVKGFIPRDPEDANADVNSAGPGYFHTLGTPLLSGREFMQTDEWNTTLVSVVNQAFVKHFFQGKSPLGKHIHQGAGGVFDIEIVGVVKDTNTLSLREAQAPAYYIPLAQFYAVEQRIRHGSSHAALTANRASFFVRSSASPASIERDVRNIVHAIAPTVPAYNVMTMTERVNDSVYTERFSALLAVLFGVLATVLAAVGLYGVVAYSVARRAPEIGIRLALGALPSQVVRLVMKEVFTLTIAGIALGVPTALALGRLIGSQLYTAAETNNVDVFFAAIAVIALSVAIAGLIPARRASLLDPKQALRYE